MLVLATPAVRAISTLGVVALLAACGAATTPPTPANDAPPLAFPPSPLPVAPPLAVVPVAEPPASTAAPAQPPEAPADPTAAAAASYRAWMEEARLLHPYAEPVEHMWGVMLCESSGNAAVVAGSYHGLFQFSAETWGGAWNPYRDQPILDPRAQIFAAAKAWQDGHQAWWGCY